MSGGAADYWAGQFRRSASRASRIRDQVSWESGALDWTAQTRTDFANDLGLPSTLVAVTDEVNQSKGDRDPGEWLPPRTAAHCRYATRWVKVKYRWRLSIDAAERARLAEILSGDCGSKTLKIPRRAV